MTKKEELYNAIGLLTGGELLETLSDEQLDQLWKSIVKENMKRNEVKLDKVTKKELNSVQSKASKAKNRFLEYLRYKDISDQYVKNLADKYYTCEYDIYIKAGIEEGYI